MKKFDVQFQNFFTDKLKIDSKVSSTSEVIDLYKSINWFDLLTKATSENKGGSDIIDDNNWNFSIKYQKLKKEYFLNIYPHWFPSTNVKPNEIKLILEFKESKIVPSSKLFQFFGGSKEKTVEENITGITDVLQEETLEYLTNFLNTNLIGLRKFPYKNIDSLIENVNHDY